jgi:membrane protein required for colicin V production
MTAFDYVVLAILVASIVISVLRGLVKEILSLVAWLAAFVVANLYGAWMADLLPASVPGATLRLAIGFGILFIATLLLFALVNRAIAHIVTASGLKVVDRGLGGLFGFARGALIVLSLAILAGLTGLPQEPVWRDALLSPLTESAVRTIKPWLPEAVAQHVHF